MHYWDADQIDRLLDALAGRRRQKARMAALVIWRTGLRISEALALEWGDVNFLSERPSIFVPPSKTAFVAPSETPPEREVPLHPQLVEIFRRWPGTRLVEGPVVGLPLSTASRHFREGFRRAGLDAESPGTGMRLAGAHSLRHSAALHWLYQGGVPVHVVSRWLGHASVDFTVRMYLSQEDAYYPMDRIP